MRVLQITDLHILPKPNTQLYGLDTYRSLERVLEKAMSDHIPPDLIIATGDLVEDGSVTSYARLRTLLSKTKVPVFVAPGNHDSVSNMAEALLGDAIQMPFSHALNGWCFVFLNSQIPGEGHGEVKPEQIARLTGLVEAEPKTQFLVALHHTPNTPCAYPGCRLEGREMLLDMLDTYDNVRCVISGHAHEQVEIKRGNALVVTTPATSAQAWHAQEGESSNPDDFWASHRFDPTKFGYRTIDLLENGDLETMVHWIKN